MKKETAILCCILALSFMIYCNNATTNLINAKLDKLEAVQEQVTLNKVNKALLDNNINVVFEKE